MSFLLLWLGVLLLWVAFMALKANKGTAPVRARPAGPAPFLEMPALPLVTDAAPRASAKTGKPPSTLAGSLDGLHLAAAAARAFSPPPPARGNRATDGQLRALRADELAGLTVNLYAARGFRLLRQELATQAGELLFESPSRSHVLVRCIPSSNAAGALEKPDAQDPRNLLRHTVFVTEGGFPEDVRGWAGAHRLELVDGTRLLQLLRTHLPGAAEALHLVTRRPKS